MIKKASFTMILILFIGQIVMSQENIEFRGVSLSMSNKETQQTDINSIKNVNANWVSIVPYGFLRDHQVHYDSDFQWSGERKKGIQSCIKKAHDKGLKTLVKPHIWISHGDYTGDYTCENEEDWVNFEESYRAYIMTFVKLAVEEEAEMFCIGTEWESFVQKRPQFWKDLIDEIRTIYNGKLIYAANWDEYQKVPFWNKLDFIGIDSYFPLSLSPNPKYAELISSWKSIMPLIEQYSSLKKKKIVFTEFGFKSTTHATVAPWEHKDEGKYSAKVQNMAFKSFFQTIWKKNWFKGGFIWKWYHNHANAGGKGDKDFTPQNKPAEETIRMYYGK
jgi:Glycoside Hydrolase Family 113